MSRLALRLDRIEAMTAPSAPPRLFFGTTLANVRDVAAKVLPAGYAGPVMLIHWMEPDHAERA